MGKRLHRSLGPTLGSQKKLTRTCGICFGKHPWRLGAHGRTWRHTRKGLGHMIQPGRGIEHHRFCSRICTEVRIIFRKVIRLKPIGMKLHVPFYQLINRFIDRFLTR